MSSDTGLACFAKRVTLMCFVLLNVETCNDLSILAVSSSFLKFLSFFQGHRDGFV